MVKVTLKGDPLMNDNFKVIKRLTTQILSSFHLSFSHECDLPKIIDIVC